jgi:hypothetical protein
VKSKSDEITYAIVRVAARCLLGDLDVLPVRTGTVTVDHALVRS